MRYLLIIASLVLFTFNGQSQDIEYARKVLKKLSGKSMHGRGYVKNGDGKAAEYIASQFEKFGLSSYTDNYFQDYNIPINTFPGKIKLEIDDTSLKGGEDYVISCSSPAINGSFPIYFLHDSIKDTSQLFRLIRSNNFVETFLVTKETFRSIYGQTINGVKGIITLTEKAPWWHVSKCDQVEETVWLKIKADKLTGSSKQISLSAENTFYENYKTQNVIGYVKGKKNPNIYVAYSAHYDHLGMMGNKTYFPGANDNGSGTAMLLDMARYYSLPENQPDNSIVFMAFSGEESGLHGSNHYVKHPYFPLETIVLLVNLDMVGSGSDGITIVNGKAYKGLFDEMVTINETNNFIPGLKDRGEACNSDHCPFYQIGVKAVFIYTRGLEHTEYHTIYDTDDDFPFTVYEGLFKLLTTYAANIE